MEDELYHLFVLPLVDYNLTTNIKFHLCYRISSRCQSWTLLFLFVYPDKEESRERSSSL